jgi:hypothetical protein
MLSSTIKQLSRTQLETRTNAIVKSLLQLQRMFEINNNLYLYKTCIRLIPQCTSIFSLGEAGGVVFFGLLC